MRVEVITSVWGAGDVEYVGGVHDDVQITRKTAPLFAAGEAAGVIRITDATSEERKLLDGHVQSQEDGETAYAAAQESGAWQHGNHVDFVARRNAQRRRAGLSKSDRARLEAELAAATERLKEIPAP